MLTVFKNRILYIIKVISIIILILIPLNISAAIPANAESYNWPAIIQGLEGKYRDNPSDAKLKSELATAYNNYGLIFATNQEWTQAEAYLNKAYSINPSSAIKKNLSNVYVQHGLDLFHNQKKQYYTNYAHQDAKNLANKALSLDPLNINGLLLLGDIEYTNQQMSAAVRSWEKAAALVPGNKQVQQRLAQINREAEAESNMYSVFDPFFIIKIDKEIANMPQFDVSRVLSDARNKVSRDFQYTQTGKLAVIVYSKQEYLDTLQNAPDWSEAAYDGKLRIGVSLHNQNFAQLTSNIIHEYTHAVMADITNKNIPKWLNEGIAKYEEYRHGVKPRIYVLALAYNTKTILSWESIDKAFTSPNKTEALLAYQQSFSFVYYLVQRYGMTKLIALLHKLGENVDIATATQEVYNQPLTEIQKDWNLWLTNFIQQWAESTTTQSYN